MYKAVSLIQLQKIKNGIAKKYDYKVPTYEVALPGGATQIFEYDDNSIKDAPPEDVKKWEIYIATKSKMDAEVSETSVAYILHDGIEAEIDDEWLEKQKWLGIEIPTNKYDLKVSYITTGVLKTPQDISNAIVEIMKVSMKGVDKGAVKAAEDTFRNIVE